MLHGVFGRGAMMQHIVSFINIKQYTQVGYSYSEKVASSLSQIGIGYRVLNKSTAKKTLDIIMSCGFSIDYINTKDPCFSDHKPIVFTLYLVTTPVVSQCKSIF